MHFGEVSFLYFVCVCVRVHACVYVCVCVLKLMFCKRTLVKMKVTYEEKNYKIWCDLSMC